LIDLLQKVLFFEVSCIPTSIRIINFGIVRGGSSRESSGYNTT
jgi:hypothetical protein